MRYSGMILRKDNKQFKQISKAAAKKIFVKGGTIWLHSSNMVFDNPWEGPIHTNLEEEKQYCPSSDPAEIFECACNSYSCYNCDKIRGKRINFFVEIEK